MSTIGLLWAIVHASLMDTLRCVRTTKMRASYNTNQYSRMVMLSTNDVYKMVGRSNDRKVWTFSGNGQQVRSLCNTDEAAPGCFPSSFVKHLGMKYEDIENIRLPFSSGGSPQSVLADTDLGCTRNRRDLRKADAKFGNLLDFGKTVQLRKQRHLQEDSKTLFLNILQGDFLSPSYTASQTLGEHMLALMNEMETDLVSFGNHDFDFGRKCKGDQLCVKERMLQSNFMWLGANTHPNNSVSQLLGKGAKVPKSVSYKVGDEKRMLSRNSKVFPPGESAEYHRDYWVVHVSGRKVCFFGTTQNDDAASSARGTVRFTDVMDSSMKTLHALQGEKCNLIVALTHQRTGYDIMLYNRAVEANLPVPDIIWGAHDHYAAIVHLQHPRHPKKMTYIWKMGADAHLLGEMTIMPVGEPSFRLIPVIEGSCDAGSNFCDRSPAWRKCGSWASKYESTYRHFASEVLKLQKKELPILFRGVYDTANVRIRETRAANLMADLSRIGARADLGLLHGGHIRQDAFDPKPLQGANLSELDLTEEFPFDNGLGAVEITLLQLHGLVGEAVTDLLNGGVSATRTHWSGLSVTFDKRGPLAITFDGPCHVGGLLDRRLSHAGSPYPCGTPLWTRRNQFGSRSYLEKLSLAASAYALFEDSKGLLRASGDVAEVESMCSHKSGTHSVKSSFLQKPIRCSGGQPVREYYVMLAGKAPWTGCVDINDSQRRGKKARQTDKKESCWPKLAGTPGRKVVQWRQEKNGRKLFPEHASHFTFGGLHSERIISAAKQISWTVGGESQDELLTRGIAKSEIVVVPHDNLYIQRMLPDDLREKQKDLLRWIEYAKKTRTALLGEALEDALSLLNKAVEEHEHLPEHVNQEVQFEVQAIKDVLGSLKTSSNASTSLLQNHASRLCFAALRAAKAQSAGASEDGRGWFSDQHGLCTV